MQVNFWGVRGSHPCWGDSHNKIGGQTSCVTASIPNQEAPFIFDMGTGIIELGRDLLENGVKNITIILSHFHLDHMIGLPFFKPIWDKDTTITFYTPFFEDSISLEEILKTKLFCPPIFPIPYKDIPARCYFKSFKTGEDIKLTGGAILKTLALNHPGQATGYRLEYNNKSFCYITDHEHSSDFDDTHMIDFIKQTDLMTFDTMYTPEDIEKHITWGHSCWRSGVEVAQKASVKKFALFHISPEYDDDTLLEIEANAQKEFKGAFLAREGTGIEL